MDIAQELIEKIKSGKFNYRTRLGKVTQYRGVDIEVCAVRCIGGCIGYEVFSSWGEGFSESIVHLHEPNITMVRKRYKRDNYKVV